MLLSNGLGYLYSCLDCHHSSFVVCLGDVMVASLVDRLKGNGEPWTFAEVIDYIEQVTADRDVCVGILEQVRLNLKTPPGKPLTKHSEQIGENLP